MPRSAPRPCTYPGCGLLVDGGSRCPAHRSAAKKQYEAQRESAAKRGYGRTWQKASKAYLRAHPLCECVECKAGELRVLPSTVVDHKIPHRGDMELFWDRDNWQAMAKVCHDKKTARDDGAFGNATSASRE